MGISGPLWAPCWGQLVLPEGSDQGLAPEVMSWESHLATGFLWLARCAVTENMHASLCATCPSPAPDPSS